VSLLLTLIPGPYRWLVLAALALALVAFGWVKGNQHGTQKLTDYQAAQVLATEKVIVKQGKITERVVTEYVEVKTKAQVVTQTIQTQVTKYAEAAPRLTLDANWVRLHDSAALGALPDPAGNADGTPGETTAAQALQAVTENYGACLRNADKLSALQDWVKRQQ
jgi:hypothetical protein